VHGGEWGSARVRVRVTYLLTYLLTSSESSHSDCNVRMLVGVAGARR